MAIIESESLILKSYSLAEADKIVVFLTQGHGLVRGVAKGAKRLKSRFGGSLEPFSVVNLTFFQREERELVSISNIELQESYFTQAARPEVLQKFSYLSELLVEFAPPNEPNERLYRMARICLETAANDPGSLEAIVLYFELWLLRLAGFLPVWSNCDGCRSEFTSGAVTNLQINFHLLCLDCLRNKPRVPVTPAERRVFTLAQSVSPPKFSEAARDFASEVRAISQILKKIISHILGKENVGERILITGQL
jgi:DNA repair protein RecO (recombination protein O)